MKVGINIDRSVEEIEVLITAHEQSRTVNALYEHIVEFDKKSLETLTAYKDDIVKIVNVTDVFRISTFKHVKASLSYGTDCMNWKRLSTKNSFSVSLIQKS